MDHIHDRCAGLDVPKKTVVACIRQPGPDGSVDSRVRTFGTMTADLLALSDWLDAAGVRHVAMESTGVYWRPIYNILEGRFAVMLVNAGRLKQVPGRKTDVKDAEWTGATDALAFDESKEGELLRRYQLGMARAFYRSVDTIYKAQREAARRGDDDESPGPPAIEAPAATLPEPDETNCHAPLGHPTP